jgi:hypothetical protein
VTAISASRFYIGPQPVYGLHLDWTDGGSRSGRMQRRENETVYRL